MIPTNYTEITDKPSPSLPNCLPKTNTILIFLYKHKPITNQLMILTHLTQHDETINHFHMLPLLIKRTSNLLFPSILSTPRRIGMDSWTGKNANNTNNNNNNNNKLLALAQQLRFYSPPVNEDDEEEVGIVESVVPVVNQERFKPKRAAVLICLFEGDHGEFRVFLTKRSAKLSTHSGEVSLPGGKADELDANDAETATREAKEEIGLDPSLVNVVTCLEPFLSKHLLRVIPVIGILANKEEFSPTPNAAEVEAIFDAPLEMFLKDENRRSEEREWLGNKYLIHFFDYEMKDKKKYVIWGLTAGILIRAASVVYQKPPAFVEQNPKFKLPTVVQQDTTMP